LSNSTEALVGALEVPMAMSGVHFARPWGIKTARKMVTRIKVLFALYQVVKESGMSGVTALIDNSFDEVVGIVCDSYDITQEDLEDESKYLMEDLFALVEGLIRVNFIDRPGMVEKFLSLIDSMNVLVDQGEEPPSEENLSLTPQ